MEIPVDPYECAACQPRPHWRRRTGRPLECCSVHRARLRVEYLSHPSQLDALLRAAPDGVRVPDDAVPPGSGATTERPTQRPAPVGRRTESIKPLTEMLDL